MKCWQAGALLDTGRGKKWSMLCRYFTFRYEFPLNILNLGIKWHSPLRELSWLGERLYESVYMKKSCPAYVNVVPQGTSCPNVFENATYHRVCSLLTKILTLIMTKWSIFLLYLWPEKKFDTLFSSSTFCNTFVDGQVKNTRVQKPYPI